MRSFTPGMFALTSLAIANQRDSVHIADSKKNK